jgi:hypothetical protein
METDARPVWELSSHFRYRNACHALARVFVAMKESGLRISGGWGSNPSAADVRRTSLTYLTSAIRASPTMTSGIPNRVNLLDRTWVAPAAASVAYRVVRYTEAIVDTPRSSSVRSGAMTFCRSIQALARARSCTMTALDRLSP